MNCPQSKLCHPLYSLISVAQDSAAPETSDQQKNSCRWTRSAPPRRRWSPMLAGFARVVAEPVAWHPPLQFLSLLSAHSLWNQRLKRATEFSHVERIESLLYCGYVSPHGSCIWSFSASTMAVPPPFRLPLYSLKQTHVQEATANGFRGLCE